MSPFQYEYAKLGANVCGSGMNAELRMTCRGRTSILGPPQLCAQASGFLVLGHFLRRWPYGRESGVMVMPLKLSRAVIWKTDLQINQ
jgi:hypothetical protein